MKAKINTTKEVELKTIHVKANVRYWEDATINGVEDENGDLTPCREGDLWCPIIDIDTGIIQNWEQGKKADIHFKVCDQCSYELKDSDNVTHYSVEDEYVPNTLCPKERGYGDYIIMDIDVNGQIKNWRPEVSDLLQQED
jgi:hypothetical protein